MPFVYFIHEEGGVDCFKIGKTENHPLERAEQLQTGNPRKLVIYRYISVENHSIVEKYLHDKYREFNIRNEWFNLSKSIIDEECDLIKCNDSNAAVSERYAKCGFNDKQAVRASKGKKLIKPAPDHIQKYWQERRQMCARNDNYYKPTSADFRPFFGAGYSLKSDREQFGDEI